MNEHGYEIDPGLEERARSLLTAAAETVPVSPGPVPRPASRPVWPWLVAAAAMAVLLVGVPVLLGAPPERRPAPAPAPGGEVSVPQTLWMTEAQARETLEEAGLSLGEVRFDASNECDLPEGRVLSSRPAPTREVRAGVEVTLTLTSPEPSTAYCVRPPRFGEAVALLDLARFGETDLEFAPRVEAYVDGKLTRSLTSAEAADPDAWGDPSPLMRLVSALDQVHPVQGRGLVSPSVSTMTDNGGQYACGENDPAPGLADRPSLLIVVEDVLDGPVGACRWFRIYPDTAGRIAAVTSVESAGTGLSSPSDGGVPVEPTAEQHAVAEAFAAYARGGEPPAFTSDVDILLGNRVFASASDVEAGPRVMWAVRCAPGYGERACPIDVLEVVAGTRSLAITSTVARERSMCHTVFGELPADLTTAEALQRSVSLSVPEPGSCMDNWELQLWLDDDDRIYAANLILGSP